MFDKDKQYEFQHYVVGIIDLLSQSNVLEKLSRLPLDGDHAAYLEAVRSSVGNILLVRDAVQSFFENFNQYELSPNVQAMSAEQQAEYRSYRGQHLTIQQFSDTIVCYAPVKNAGGVNVGVVNALLGAFGCTMLMSLAAGIPLRGGIDIDVAVELGGQDIYGPALLRAYRQESKVAEFPRVAVGPALIDFLDTYRLAPKVDRRTAFNKAMAGGCFEMLNIDASNVTFVDYLGEHFATELRKPVLWPAVESAFKFVLKQQQLFNTPPINETLAHRYRRLREYFLLRFPELAG